MDQRPPRGSLRGPLASRRLRPVTAEGRHALVEVNARPAGPVAVGAFARLIVRRSFLLVFLAPPR
jgi:hypothetical protein